MTSTPADKLAEVTRAFQDRINNYATDMVTATEDEAALIDQQLHDAETALNETLEKAFLGDTPEIESVTTNLKASNDQVDALRAQDEMVAKILAEAGQAISLAKTLTLMVG